LPLQVVIREWIFFDKVNAANPGIVSQVSSLYWEVQAEERAGYQAPDKESLRFILFKLISGPATALKKELAASSHVVGR
jgi:hypothetical protein